jgi:hypothetical protein
MRNAVLGADTIKQQFEGVTILLAVGKLNSVIGQDGVDFVGNSGDEMAQEFDRDRPSCPLIQFGIDKLGDSVNGNEQLQLTFFSADLGNVDVKIADGILLETLFLRLRIGHLGQATNAGSLQPAMQSGSREVWDGVL